MVDLRTAACGLAVVAFLGGGAACSSDGHARTAPSPTVSVSPSASVPVSPSASAPAVAERIKAPKATRLDRTDEFGLVHVVRVGAVDVDRVDMLSGVEAERAAAAHGGEVSNDYFLVNDNPRLRRYDVRPDAIVWGSIGMVGQPDAKRVTLAAWYRFLATDAGKHTLFHLTVQDGAVVGIEEQYQP